jgi:hypothetical protein
VLRGKLEATYHIPSLKKCVLSELFHELKDEYIHTVLKNTADKEPVPKSDDGVSTRDRNIENAYSDRYNDWANGSSSDPMFD